MTAQAVADQRRGGPPRAERARAVQDVRLHEGAGRRRLRPARWGDPRAGRTERLRQVDADQGPGRLPPARRRRGDPVVRGAGRPELDRRLAQRGLPVRAPGPRPRRDPEHGREPHARARARHGVGRADPLGRRAPRRGASDGRPGLPLRRTPSGGRARGRRTHRRRDRPGALGLGVRSGAGGRRADRVAAARGGGDPVRRSGARAHRGAGRHLRVAPPRRDLRDRRPGHRAARREARRHLGRRRHRPGRSGLGDDRRGGAASAP